MTNHINRPTVSSPASSEGLLERFKTKALAIHGEKYDYSLVEYKNCKTHIRIRCNTCNLVFSQTPDNHLQGKGCPGCSGNLPYDFERYIQTYTEIHGSYDYLGWYREKGRVILKVSCPIHGEFHVRHTHHLNGVGCKRCTYDEKRIQEKDFLSKLHSIHGDRYEIKDLTDLHFRKELEVYCKEHDLIFRKTLRGLLKGGCPKCFARVSRGENELHDWISRYREAIQTYRASWLGKQSLDIYIPSLSLAIEYNGIYWHSEHNDRIYKEYHLDKYLKCKENNIDLIHIFEFESLDKWKRRLMAYFDNPDAYSITFKNNKRTVGRYTLYGQSFIRKTMKPIINLDNDTYKDRSKRRLVLGEQLGLKDTINIENPYLVNLYDKLKSQDWTEDELNMEQDRIDLVNAPQTVKDLFKLNLTYQFEIDSLLSETYCTLLAPFVTDSQYADMLSIIQYNEGLHAKSYLFTIRKVFPDPNEIFDLIERIGEVQERSEVTFKCLSDLKEAGAKYVLGMVENNQELFNIVFKGIFSFYILEKFNFMSSFATTFIIPEAFNGLMMNSSKQVQKIAQDELIHWQAGEYVIKKLISDDPRGKIAFEQCREELIQILEESLQAEYRWSDFILSEGREVVGLNSKLLKDYVLWNMNETKRTLGLYDGPKEEMPLKFMQQWLDLDSVQHAMQESSSNNYLLNTVVNDLDDDLNLDW